MPKLNEAELRLLVRHLPDFTVVVDAQGCFQSVHRLESTLTEEEVIGVPVAHFTSEADKGIVRARPVSQDSTSPEGSSTHTTSTSGWFRYLPTQGWGPRRCSWLTTSPNNAEPVRSAMP